MPITSTPMTIPGAPSAPSAFPLVGGGSLPSFPMVSAPSGMGADPASIIQLLSQAPTSVTANLMPGLMQILGLQTGMQLPFLQQQGQGMVADAMSDAAKRGLTGSSIEAANMTGARAAGNMNLDQFLAQQLGTLGGAYQGAVGTDVANQNAMYNNLAQALGQLYGLNIQAQQFQQEQSNMMSMASAANKTALWGAGIGALGSIAGGTMQGAGNAGSMAALFCDRRVKQNIKWLGRFRGFNFYAFEYKPEFVKALGLRAGRQVGLMADEVAKVLPDVVRRSFGVDVIDAKRLCAALGV